MTGEQTTPTLAQNRETGRWYIVTSWHKPGHPKKKYDVTGQMKYVIETAIESFVKQVEAEAKKEEEAKSEEMRD